VVLNEGHVQQAGTAAHAVTSARQPLCGDLYRSPTINLLPARVIEVSDSGARLWLATAARCSQRFDVSQLQVGETVEVGLRPEHCEVSNANVASGVDDTALDAEITLVEHLGESNLLYLKMDDGQELIVRGEGNAEVRLGDSVIVRFAPSSPVLVQGRWQRLHTPEPGNMRSPGRPMRAAWNFESLPAHLHYAIAWTAVAPAHGRVWCTATVWCGCGQGRCLGVDQGTAQAWRHIGQAIALAVQGRLPRRLVCAQHLPTARWPGLGRCQIMRTGLLNASPPAPATPLALESDAVTALLGAHGGAPGAMVIMGTGAIWAGCKLMVSALLRVLGLPLW